MPEPAVIDPQAIENLRSLNPGDDDQFIREIVAMFLEDAPQRLAELDQCLASGDSKKFARAAHSIKGSSSNLGAMALRREAERLEESTRTAPPAALAPQIAAVKTEFERAKAELRRLFP